MQLMAQSLTTQANKDFVAPENPVRGIFTSRVKEFLRMNPLENYGSKVEEDPQNFID